MNILAKKSLKSAQIIWALFFYVLLAGAYYQTEGHSYSLILVVFATLCLHTLFTDGIDKRQHIVVWSVCSLLVVYSFFNSKILGRSLNYSLIYLCAFHFYLCIYNTEKKQKKLGFSFLKFTVGLLFIYILFHTFIALRQYYLVPIRTFGMFRDYSQASFAILIGFFLAYPWLRSKTFSPIVTALLFTAFFSTFSRTSNFLLAFMIIAVGIHEFKNNSFKTFLPHLIAIAIGYTAAITYPVLVSEAVVDRGGLHHFKTLNSRAYYWTAAFNAIKENWLWGAGIGTYQYTGIREVVPFREITSAHNDYIEVWHDLGIIWFFIFIATLVFSLIKLAPFSISKQDFFECSLSKYLAWTLLLSMCMYMCINFIAKTYFFVMAFALLVAILNSNDPNSHENP